MTRTLGGTPAFAMALAAVLSATPISAATVANCPGVIPPGTGTSIGGNADLAHQVTSASALSAVAPDGKTAFSPFGYLYTTRGAGAYLEDGFPHGWIVHVDGTGEGSVRDGLAKLQTQLPASRLSQGATMILEQSWTLTILPCAPRS